MILTSRINAFSWLLNQSRHLSTAVFLEDWGAIVTRFFDNNKVLAPETTEGF